VSEIGGECGVWFLDIQVTTYGLMAVHRDLVGAYTDLLIAE
jgi:hypothetical protein